MRIVLLLGGALAFFSNFDAGGSPRYRSGAQSSGAFRDWNPLGAFCVQRILLVQWRELGGGSTGFPLWRIRREQGFCVSRTRGFR
jgi:hypothetical protein